MTHAIRNVCRTLSVWGQSYRSTITICESGRCHVWGQYVTPDLSHTATAGTNPVEMAAELGNRLAHVHLADGSGSAKDEHLVPGRGTQRGAELLGLLADHDFRGHIMIEINTRRAISRSEREADLVASLEFTRTHFTRGRRPRSYAVTSDGEVSELP